MFRLGTRHIAEGTDHLLFLLALILPAPLVASGGRWGGYAGAKTASRRIVKVVTAFTVGHSDHAGPRRAGLGAPARRRRRIGHRPLDLRLGLSTPWSRSSGARKIYIAGGFGLVHGLAFAATLAGLGLDPLTLASSVLGFNLGIEAFQILIILLRRRRMVRRAGVRLGQPRRTARRESGVPCHLVTRRTGRAGRVHYPREEWISVEGPTSRPGLRR